MLRPIPNAGSTAPPVRAEEADGLGEAARIVARRLHMPARSPARIALLAALVDLVAFGLAFWFTSYAQGAPSVGAALALGLAATGIVRLSGGHRVARLARFWPGLLLACAAGAVAAAAALALGRAGLLAWPLALALPACLLPARAVMRLIAVWVVGFGLTERRAVLIGGGEEGRRLIRGLAANPDNDIRICGVFDDRGDERVPLAIAGVPKLGSTESLLSFVREARIEMVIIALPLTAEARIRQLIEPLTVLPVDLRLSAASADFEFRRHGRTAAPAPLVGLMAPPLDDAELLAKRALDLVLGAAALLLLALPMAVVAAAIRLDSPGPILFRQERHGFNHRPVRVLKFRSMYADRCDAGAREIVTRGDPRVTRVGRFIRRTSLDELPQLFNVLRGDLSLVGPRPHAVVALSSRQVAFDSMVNGYAARHKMRPGITGWAQINGWRGEIDDPEKLRRRFEHDLYYIENWSLALDLKILVLTPLRLLDTRAAY